MDRCAFVDEELRSLMSTQVQCVDFRLMEIKGPRLSMELCSGESIRRVQKSTNPSSDSVMSIHELTMLDMWSFSYMRVMTHPEFFLIKDGAVTWTPIATRRRSRVSCKDNNVLHLSWCVV